MDTETYGNFPNFTGSQKAGTCNKEDEIAEIYRKIILLAQLAEHPDFSSGGL